MTHTHQHPHTDPHTHAEHAGTTGAVPSAAPAHAPMPPPSREGSVVLDIGAGTGALIIRTSAADDGLEIEVSPLDDPGRRTHAAVRPRHLAGGSVHCLVISPLPAGPYTVWADADTPHGTVEVAEGAVSEYLWS